MRGLCFGLGAPHGPSPGDCLACLSAAAEDVWRAGCFLSYADTNTSTARDTKAMIDVIVDLLGNDLCNGLHLVRSVYTCAVQPC